MEQAAETIAPRRRKLSREVRRQQLIEATIACIAKRGFAETTLAEVAKTAGLSQGIVNLHFNTKDQLLFATLAHLRDEYKETWTNAYERAGGSAAEKLAALMAVDFEPGLCGRDKLAVWFAFQAEAKSRPTYRELCEQYDEEYDRVLEGTVRKLIREDGTRGLNAKDIAAGFSAMAEGLWLCMLVTPSQMTAKDARRICRSYFAQFFPQHYAKK